MGLVEDPVRLAAVERAGLLDTEAEQVFDELTSAAAELLDAPFAFMTAVDTTRSFWKSTYGVDDGTRQNTVGDSFCRYVIESGGQDLIVGDTTRNETTKDNPSIESMGVRAWAGCAVMLDEQPLGTFCVVDQRTRDWTATDREVLRRLAAVASREIALRADLIRSRSEHEEAVRESERHRQLVDTLRQSLMPPSPPRIPGIDLAVWFEPATDGADLLGDFYDAFQIDDRRWGVVIGDVCGHGPEAARLTSLIRYSLRSAAMHHPDDPAAVLAEVDHAMHRDGTADGRFATLAYLVFDPFSTPLAVRWARAGHPYPIIRRDDGSLSVADGASGAPIALTDEPAIYDADTFEMGPGDVVVLHTDGYTESRDASGAMLGTDVLHDVLRAGPGNADALVVAARQRLGEAAPTRHDDVIVVAIGVPPAA